MANRFWVGGTGNWDTSTTTHWSTSSGGAGGASVPSTTDDIIFDSSSNASSYTVTITANSLTSQSLTMGAPASGQITFSGSFSLNISGSINLSGGTSGINWTHTGTVGQGASGTGTITSNNIVFGGGVVRNFTGTTTLGDDFSCVGVLTVTTGTFDANNHSITAASVTLGSGTLTLGSATHFITGTGSTAWSITGGTLSASTGTIKFTDTSNTGITFAGGGKTYNNVWFSRGTSIATNTITGTNTFADFKDDGTGAHTITFPNVTTTVTTFHVSNTSNLTTLTRTGGSGTFTLSASVGIISCNFLSISNSTATGGATWYAGANSTDGGTNSGWIFTAPPAAAPTITGISTVTGISTLTF